MAAGILRVSQKHCLSPVDADARGAKIQMQQQYCCILLPLYAILMF